MLPCGYHDVDDYNEGEDYRTDAGVDVDEYATDQFSLGWTQEGEWLNYTVNVATSGAYTFNARVASPNDNAIFHAEIDGVDVTGPMEIDSTGGWTTWDTLSKEKIYLTAGQHVLKVVMDERSTQEQWIGDFDWFSFTSESAQVSFRSVSSLTPDTRTNSTISAPTGIENKDILIATLYVENDVAVTAPAGWMLISSLDHPNQPMDTYVYWKRASSESGSYTWTHTSAPSSGAIAAYSGAKEVGSPFDATTTTNQGISTSLTGTGLTTATNGSMLVLTGGLWAWINSVTTPGGMNERVDNTVIYLADQSIASASATGNRTGTISGSDHWSAFLLALAPEPNMHIPATESVIDDWSSGSISSEVWDDWGGLRTSVAEKQVTITSTTGAGYYGMLSGANNASQDLTGSFVSNELVSAGNQSLSSFQAFPVYLHKKGDNTNQLEFLVGNNTVYAKKKVGGSLTTIHSSSYNAAVHKYFRIREDSGTIYFDTSVDGKTWTNFTSTASPFDISKVVVGQMAGTWQTEASSTSATFDNFNVVTPVITYDENGNMTQDGNMCYAYNEANEMERVAQCSNDETIAEYVYDYAGIRLVKKNYSGGSLANTVISWSKSFETKDMEGGGIETTNYFFANRELVAMKKPGGIMRYMHSDHLGSTTVITDQSGDLVEESTFGPWGELMEGGTESKYQFTGQEKDEETGLNYMNARYYDAELKRFTQPDKLIQNFYDPQMLNRYAYARNNPLKYIDPSGKAITISATGRIGSTISFVNNQIPNNKPSPVAVRPPLPSQQIASIVSAAQNQPVRTSSSNTPIILSGNNGNNNGNITQTSTGPDPVVSNAWNKGSVDVSAGAGFGYISANLGQKINRFGSTPTGGVNAGYSYKFGATVIYSQKPVEQNKWDHSTTLGVVKAIQWGYDPLDPLNVSKWEYQGEGVGCCGIESGPQYTGSTTPNVDFRSTPLNNINSNSLNQLRNIPIELYD